MTPAPLPLPVLFGRVFLPFAAGYFLSYLYRSVNAVIGPDLTGSMGLDAAALGLLTSAYFLAFAAAQLPLGLLLDRFGPRRVEATLLMFAAAGALVFGLGEGLPGLVVGRALIGFGVSACLMAAMKANVLFFPRDSLPLVNGVILAAGGLGALSATAPVEAALTITDWRGIFYALAATTAAVAAFLFVTVPERPTGLPGGGLAAQLRDTGQIYKSALFWRQAPLPMVSQSTFMSVEGLWAGSWLRDVDHFDRAGTAEHLFGMAAAMIVGFVSWGAIAVRLGRLGVRPAGVAITGMLLFMLCQLALWTVFGFLGTAGTVMYAALAQSFPPHLAGRVNTALNLLVFVAAFGVQWGIGAIIDQWPKQAGGYPPEAYTAAFGTMLALQGVACAWLALPRRKGK